MMNYYNTRNTTPLQVQEYLGGIHYPAHKHDLIKHAQSQEADEMVLETLDRIGDREYDGPADVSQELGRIT